MMVYFHTHGSLRVKKNFTKRIQYIKKANRIMVFIGIIENRSKETFSQQVNRVFFNPRKFTPSLFPEYIELAYRMIFNPENKERLYGL